MPSGMLVTPLIQSIREISSTTPPKIPLSSYLQAFQLAIHHTRHPSSAVNTYSLKTDVNFQPKHCQAIYPLLLLPYYGDLFHSPPPLEFSHRKIISTYFS